MARGIRIEFEGAIHHVWMRGNRKQDIFRDDHDRRFFLDHLRRTAQVHKWVCLSYCLMSNHCHIVIETPEPTLSKGMHRFNTIYAVNFNARYSESGHLYQSRFGSGIVDTDEYLAQLFRYVALNPVMAGLCATPEDWRWSSHRQLWSGAGNGFPAGERVETLLGGWDARSGGRYARLFDPTCELAFTYGAEDPAAWRPPLESLLSAQSREEGVQSARDYGYKLREIADALGVTTQAVSRLANRAR